MSSHIIICMSVISRNFWVMERKERDERKNRKKERERMRERGKCWNGKGEIGDADAESNEKSVYASVIGGR